MTRRALLAALVGIAALWAALGAHPAAADSGQPPAIWSVSPSLVSAGQPVRVTITGASFTGASSVTTDPPSGGSTFQVFNDTTILLTLAKDLPTGYYSVHVTTNAGTGISANGFTVTPKQVVNTPVPSQAPSGPAPSLAPPPAVVTSPAPPVVAPAPAQAVAPAPVAAGPLTTRAIDNPVITALLGFAVGGLMFALWGKEGRLRVARRRGFFAQLWARPVQRIRLGRICLHCGRLHYIVRTRRDLWKAGRFCSATCFVADQEAELAKASSDEVAPLRMRGVGVYVEMEQQLQAALRAEAAEVRAGMFATDEPDDDEPVVVAPGARSLSPWPAWPQPAPPAVVDAARATGPERSPSPSASA